jgi:hypothetical protein
MVREDKVQSLSALKFDPAAVGATLKKTTPVSGFFFVWVLSADQFALVAPRWSTF